MPYGTQVLVEAEPAAGFHFLTWSGSSVSHSAAIGIEMTHRHELHAHFVPVRLHEAFPYIEPTGIYGWFAENDGGAIAPVNVDWAYSETLGWFHTGERGQSGTWLCTANHGWLWRPVGQPAYFNVAEDVWWLE